MNVHVLGVATAAPSLRNTELRLEELVYRTVHTALESAGVSQRQLDHLSIGACDEMDGRPISSMLMAAPSGGYLVDEIKVTDSGATALCLGVARILSGEYHLGLVSSWCKSSKSDIESVMNLRCDPFFTRPLGIGAVVGDALLAQAITARFQVSEPEAARLVVSAYARARRNPRGMRFPEPSIEDVLASPYEAMPIRTAHRAPLTDGAAAIVLASDAFLRRHPDAVPLARIPGVGWCSDSYRLGAERLQQFHSAAKAWQMAMDRAGWQDPTQLDVAEIEAPTPFHHAAYRRVFDLDDEIVSPSGGCFAQNPLFCTGLVNAAEAILQVAGRAGPVQRGKVRRAAAHSCNGTAQQGNVVMLFESVAN